MSYLEENAGKIHFAMTNRKLKCVSSKDIAGLCRSFGFPPNNIRTVLIRKGALVPLLFKGIFYVRSPTELLIKTLPTNPLKVAAVACNKRFGKEWYFGLHTSLKINDLAGVQTQVKTFIITKKRVKPKTRKIGSMEFVFSQISGVPFEKGIKEKNELRFSDPVRTALDFLHLGIKKKNIKYAELVLDAVLERDKKEFVSKHNKYSKYFSTSKRMNEIIEKHRGW